MTNKKSKFETKVYKSKKKKIAGTSFKEIEKKAKQVFNLIRSKTKRTPYIRAKYFNKEKVFLNIFWKHIYDKRERDRARRLKYYDCSIDLVRNTIYHPSTKDDPNNKGELLYRFIGISKDNDYFRVQIKENKKTKRKDFISIIPDK